MTIQPINEYIVVAGKIDIFLAFPVAAYAAPFWPFSPTRGAAPANGTDAYATLWKLGELEDDVEPTVTDFTLPVPGDRNGGSAGAPIEKQSFASAENFSLTLSRWDKDVYQLLKSQGGLKSNTNYAWPLVNMGSLLLRDRSFRVLLMPSKAYTPISDVSMVKNYPCCTLEGDYGMSQSTKYSRLSLRIMAQRTPEGHWSDPTGVVGTSTKIGVIQNFDITGTT
jgi:hypothetical protein